jgi:ABC-type polysaccharide/polyol phosphate export permease
LIAFLNPNGLTLNALYILPGLALAIVFGWAIATLTAFATAFFHDVTHMVEVFAQMMFFLTPIIYLPATLKEYQWTTNINPFALFIEMMRAPLIHATPASSEVYLYGGFFTLTAFTLAVGTIAWLQKKVIFHL